MDKNLLTLTDASLFSQYEIVSFAASDRASARLADLGFVAGARVCPVAKAFLKATVAVRIRGSVFCVRKEQADKIFVKRV